MNRRKRLRRIELAYRLHAVDVPIEIDVDEEGGGLLMHQIGGAVLSSAFSLKSGGMGYAVYMCITIDLPAFAISGFDLELPWSDTYLSLLEDPNETGDPHREYSFPGDTIHKFPRKAGINHYADITRMHPRGRTLQGFLLWAGMIPIPDDWPLRKKIPAFVIVYDQFGFSYKCTVTLLDTREKRSSTPERRKSVRTPLFEYSDPKLGPAKSQGHITLGSRMGNRAYTKSLDAPTRTGTLVKYGAQERT